MSTIQTQIASIVVAVVGLLLTFTVIDGTTAQAVIGAASIIIPAVFNIVAVVNTHAAAVVTAAKITAKR